MNFLLNAFDFSNFGEKLKYVFSNFSPRDVVDIILLTLILIFTFTVLRGKKARTLLIGIVICIVVLTIAKVFGLKLLASIFSGIVESGTLVIVIIFQPEIREMLEKIGQGSIKGLRSFADRRKKKELYSNVIDNICAAVSELSKECTGALIVIERSTRLDDIIENGVAFCADVNELLLRNLFYNRAPLHDGALVISNGKISAAACLLPLTQRKDLDLTLGTRHRAALGMSEMSDALVVVVSEETGIISVAKDSKLQRNLTVEELKLFLHENLLNIGLEISESK